MELKKLVKEVIQNIIKQARVKGFKTRFIYMNILRELTRYTEPLDSIWDIRKIKFVGEKTFKTIKEDVIKICAGLDENTRMSIFGRMGNHHKDKKNNEMDHSEKVIEPDPIHLSYVELNTPGLFEK